MSSTNQASGKPLALARQARGKQPTLANQARGNKSSTVSQASGTHIVEKPKRIGHEPRSSCKLCKGDDYAHLCLGIPQVQSVWSQYQEILVLDSPMSSQQPPLPTFDSHVSDHSSINDNKVKGKKGRVKFPCKLCSRSHLTYLCPCKEEDSKLLRDSVISQQKPMDCSQNPCPKQPLVEEVVDPKPSSINPTLSSKRDENITLVSFVNSYLPSQGGIPSMVPLPRPKVCSFNWNSLVEHHLPSYVPFQIIVDVLSTSMHQTVIYEGGFISILSSTTQQALGSPNLFPASNQLLHFNKGTSEPLGVLPQFPITL